MGNRKDQLSLIPTLGSGLGYRTHLRGNILQVGKEIDFLEILVDQYIENPWRLQELSELREIFPLIAHGVGLSIGSIGSLDRTYLASIKHISDITKTPYYSEHLCVTKVPGIDLGHLAPLWFTENAVKTTIQKVLDVQDYLGKPLILENVTYLVELPGSEMSQPEFFQRLVSSTGCGILLDLTNVYINSVNHLFDAKQFIEQMPLDSIVQVHIAGGYWSHGLLIDSHSERVQEEVWNLLEFLATKVKVKGVVLEHDDNYPHIDVLLQQVARAKATIRSINE